MHSKYTTRRSFSVYFKIENFILFLSPYFEHYILLFNEIFITSLIIKARI